MTIGQGSLKRCQIGVQAKGNQYALVQKGLGKEPHCKQRSQLERRKSGGLKRRLRHDHFGKRRSTLKDKIRLLEIVANLCKFWYLLIRYCCLSQLPHKIFQSANRRAKAVTICPFLRPRGRYNTSPCQLGSRRPLRRRICRG